MKQDNKWDRVENSSVPGENVRIFDKRLISLLEMQEFFPSIIIAHLLDLRATVQGVEKQLLSESASRKSKIRMDEESLMFFGKLTTSCKAASLLMSADLAEELIGQFETGFLYVEEALAGLNHLYDLIKREMKFSKFYRLADIEAKRFESKEPYGSVIAKAFPHIQKDLQEAAKCLSLDRGTACVFHLMRAMESVTQRLGVKLRIKVKKNGKFIRVKDAGWDEITVAILNKITLRSPSSATAKERQREKRYGSIAQSLRNLKDVYRNPVAHPHEFIDPEEATMVYLRCRLFLESAAPHFK